MLRGGKIETSDAVFSQSQIDNLSYQYVGNQLLSVSDAASSSTTDVNGKLAKDYGFKDGSTSSVEYQYDLNGNMISDDNKGLSNVDYNYLDLPSKLTGTDNKTISYIYSANGQRLAKTANGKTTYYVGNIIYEKVVNEDASLQYILNSEGKYDLSSESGQYQFDIKDHLGNVRMVVSPSGTVLQQSSYYPFGMAYQKGGNDNKYLYNRKELQEDQIGGEALDWYYYGARFYDSSIGRWGSIDLLAEKTPSINQYQFCYNNPIRYIDLFGLAGVNSNKDNFGRDKRDSFSGVYIAPYDRKGGVKGSGYGDPIYGHFEQVLVGYTSTNGYKTLYRNEKNNWDVGTVYPGGEWEAMYDTYWVWDNTEEKLYSNQASNGRDAVTQWLDRSKDASLVGYKGTKYLGVGGKGRVEVLGEKIMLGVHVVTTEESMTMDGFSKKVYSGIEVGVGPFEMGAIYDWNTGLDLKFGLAQLKLSTASDPDIVLLGASCYLGGGYGGELNMNPGRLLNELSNSLNTPGVEMSKFPMAASGIYALPSDKKLKENIEKIDSSLFELKKLNGYKFTWKDDAPMNMKGHDIGLIAQEVESVFPELVQNDSIRGYKAIYYYKLIPILIEAIKEQQLIIDDQGRIIENFNQKIKAYENKLDFILQRMNELESVEN